MSPALTPHPLRVLFGRIVQEWESRRRIFDLPSGRFHHRDPALDLSIRVGRGIAATPFGPAAGPHTQLAENIVLGWLAGARTFELKTVQVLDRLEIPRPCIDMEAEGYNVEWSQELRVDESLEEYVKAWLLLQVLGEWQELRPVLGDPGSFVFDMSVGYDLAGIRSPVMDRFIRGLLDASDVIDGLRAQIPDPFGDWRTRAFPTRLVTGATLSTFHGCPPDEIEAIARHLIEEYDLDVVVKLNPTMLGPEVVRSTLDRLGHTDIPLDPASFAHDLPYQRGLDLIRDLGEFAAGRGREFGVKLTNTLVVGNHRGVLPGDVMYLSGRPLHVLAALLLDRLDADLPGLLGLGSDPGPVAVSFSAGIERDNAAAAVGLGLRPVTACTALLKPGGYGNLAAMVRALSDEMGAAGCADIASWVDACQTRALAAGHRNAIASHAAAVSGTEGMVRYGVASHKPLREVDRDLAVWDCVSCNLCVVVCPNNAMLHLPSPADAGFAERWQYLCIGELCNDCGNCVTFCPERGDPSRIKPRVFVSAEAFDAEVDQAYLVRPDGPLTITASAAGAAERERVLLLAAAPEGLPLRSEDLPAV